MEQPLDSKVEPDRRYHNGGFVGADPRDRERFLEHLRRTLGCDHAEIVVDESGFRITARYRNEGTDESGETGEIRLEARRYFDNVTRSQMIDFISERLIDEEIAATVRRMRQYLDN